MLGLYLFAAVLGGGLLVFSLFGGGDDAGGGGHDHPGGGGDHHDLGGGHHHVAGEMLFGFFRPRNLIFFLATFGVTGSLLTWLGRFPPVTLALSAVMGLGAMAASHGLFVWLRRSDAAIDALGDTDLEGSSARVVLPLEPGQPGRVVSLLGGREQYITARLAPDAPPIPAGREVVIIRVTQGVAEVAPFDPLELPPGTSTE